MHYNWAPPAPAPLPKPEKASLPSFHPICGRHNSRESRRKEKENAGRGGAPLSRTGTYLPIGGCGEIGKVRCIWYMMVVVVVVVMD